MKIKATFEGTYTLSEKQIQESYEDMKPGEVFEEEKKVIKDILESNNLFDEKTLKVELIEA